MVRVTKTERFQLEKEYGLKFHRDLHRTYSKPKHYYMTEAPRNLEILNKLRHGS